MAPIAWRLQHSTLSRPRLTRGSFSRTLPGMSPSAIHQDFTTAVDTIVAQVREDKSILAAILCGSLSHDTVWAKSDVDLVLVTVDDKKIETSDISLNADGVNV